MNALGAEKMIMTGILLCNVGLIVNVIATAGIGNTFSLMITNWAENCCIQDVGNVKRYIKIMDCILILSKRYFHLTVSQALYETTL